MFMSICILIQVHSQGPIPPDWILLDTYSADNIVNNTAMAMNLEVSNEEDVLMIYTNREALKYTQSGDFRHLPIKTNYNPESIANVLSLKKTVSEMKGLTGCPWILKKIQIVSCTTKTQF